MTDRSRVVVSGLPTDTPANRAKSAEFGLTIGGDQWPVPYKDSVTDIYNHSGVEVSVVPMTNQTSEESWRTDK